MPRPRRSFNKRSFAEQKLMNGLDDRAELEQYRAEILPRLQQAVKERWTFEKMCNDPLIASYLAAKQITIGLMSDDDAKALASLKDIRDRIHGKAPDKVDINHRVQKLSDNELDALLKTQLQEAGIGFDEPKKH